MHDLQEAGILPGLNTLAFDVSAAVPPDSWYGTLLKGVFNFSPQTTVLEAIVWVVYVAVVLTLFLLPQRSARPVAHPHHVVTVLSDRPPPIARSTMSRRSRAGSPWPPRGGRPRRLHQHRTRPDRRRRAAGGPITVRAADYACEVGGTEAPAGTITFAVNNTGTKVTEFYLYGTGDRIMGEVENIGPGLQGKLIVDGRAGELPNGCKLRHDRRGPPRRVHGDRSLQGAAAPVAGPGVVTEADTAYHAGREAVRSTWSPRPDVRDAVRAGQDDLGVPTVSRATGS